jgi:hypothetical protein
MPDRLVVTKRPFLVATAAVFLMAIPVFGSPNPETEQLQYRWKLSGFKGIVARLFVPGTGDGTLTTGEDESGSLVSELRISSTSARTGDYWLYGSQIDAGSRRTVRAWSAQQFRGKSREKESELGSDDVVDLASSIFFLRRELPEEPTEAHIWSGGRIYRVAVKPNGLGARLIEGRPVRTRSYTLKGVGQPLWRGRLDLVLAEDEAATPLEIAVARDGMRVHLELVDSALSGIGGERRH